MNILHIEEMIEVEKGLLAATPQEQYLLHLPDNQQINQLSDSSPQALPLSSLRAKQEIDKMLTHTQFLRSLKQQDPNATLKIFSCAMLAIIYPPSTGPRIAPVNNLLLETLKCTLYSADLKFSNIVGYGKAVDDFQGKAMVARFFDVLSTEKSALGSNFGKYLELFIHKNPILINIFVLFYRLVLAKLEVERAEDFKSGINFEQSIINLAEYFDISYRNRADLFLFYEENVFIALAADQVILGEYLDNEIDPKEVSFKDSEGFNLIQSFLLRSSQKECTQRLQQKQTAKVFSFTFQSGQFRFLKGDNQQGTPHFNESTQFVFGRKKKQEQTVMNDEQIKKEISNKKNLNASVDSFKDYNFNQCMAILKSIQQRQKILSNSTLNIQPQVLITTSQDKNKGIFDSPIKQIDEKLQQSKISNDRGRNIVNVKDKNITLLTPQASSNSHECFTKMDNDAMFLKDSNGLQPYSCSENMDEAKSEQNAISCCKCRTYRLARNSLASTVVNFSYIPVQKKRPVVRAPPFINNLSNSQKLVLCSSSRLNSPKVKRLNTLDEKLGVEGESKQGQKVKDMEKVKEQKSPAFLKFLKKNREMAQKQSLSSFEQSKRSQPSKQNNNFALDDRQQFKKQDKLKRLSGIQNRDKNQFRQTLRKNDFHFYFPKKKPIENNTVLKKFDTNNMHYRPALGNNWQSATHFHQITQTPRRYTRQTISTTNQHGQKVTRFYTPTVHIIAPAIYLHPNSHQNSKCLFNASPQGSEKAFLKENSRVLKTEPSTEIMNEAK